MIIAAMPYSSYKTPQEMAKAVLDHMVRLKLPLATPRPWNRHEPETTMWWLVPSTDWPAYRHGKFAFSYSRYESNRILAGIHVEKGLGGAAAPALGPTQTGLLTTNQWLWNQFLTHLASSVFGRALGSVNASSATEATILVEAAHFYPGFHPQGVHLRDEVLFRANGKTIKCQSRIIHADLLTSVAAARSLRELEDALRNVPSADWAWIDLFAGVLLDVPGEGGNGAWDAGEIWDKVLSWLRPWFR
jgi:hypothetical protein